VSTDIPRKKYLLRFNNEWIIDQQADKLLTMTFNKMTKKENFLKQNKFVFSQNK
jgi:stringent starvation protein B